MTDPIWLGDRDLLSEIAMGTFDEHLMELADALQERHQKMGTVMFDRLRVGDTVRFNYLAGDYEGTVAVVKEKKRTNVVVTLDEGYELVGNPVMLEKV